jgi:HEAT repeat protein
LCNRADDPEPAVRAEAARALGSLESLQSLPPLVATLDDHSRCVRLAATWALENLGRAAIFDAPPAKRLERLLRWSDWGQTVWEVVAGT